MRLGQLFWRLFAIVAALVLAQTLLALWLLQPHNENSPPAVETLLAVWLLSALVVLTGGVAIWFTIRRTLEPLARLIQQVRTAPQDEAGRPIPLRDYDELGLLSGAFSQLQQDLARRLAEIEQNNERLRTVLGTMTEGVLAVAPDQTILLANDAGRQLLDFATPHPVGRSLVEVTRARPVHEAVAQAFQSAEPIITEFDAAGLVRRTLTLRATRLPGDPCPGVMVVLHDLTELRRLENLRRELVANVSHELKTPLSAIKGFAETLRLGAVNDPEHNLHFVRRIEEQAERLHQLILDMLQVARLESGRETFEPARISVANLLEDCASNFREAAAARQLTLHADPADPALFLWADEEAVWTILSNLLGNAIKYTPPQGSVTVSALAGDSSITLQVRDTGIGIAEKDLPRIFERFYRADKARSRELGGTGLGLAIVKHLVQSNGGSLHVQSQPHQGSTFQIHLPRAT